MPMKMGIHCQLIGHSHSTFLDSRVRGNDGGIFSSGKRLKFLALSFELSAPIQNSKLKI